MSTWWKATIGALGFAFVVLLGLYVIDSGPEDSSAFQPVFPEGGPAEFLYLDTARVATYLAQVEGGKVESEKLSRKLTQSLNTKVAVKELGELGATQATELAAERTLKPTAASSFFALQTRLMDAKVVKTIDPPEFEEDVERLREGKFVTFETSALQSPIYLNAYFAVLHAGTLAAIFPNSRDDRKRAENFFEKVGPTARAAFALEQDGFVYLLPVTAPLLSSERSLLKYGGGEFTVFGKLVRRFPEPMQGTRELAYVDSATQETWEQALRRAPGELLCRTAPQCAAEIREHGGEEVSDAERAHAIKDNRREILGKLEEQTTIPDRGAVILPIAIYK
ncbi:MAG TPA: hypothetical protein VMS60_00420 [Solirubrobacterales bacterium]|nr:hypothetical protein [Solirubrobacterales bacterium]